MEINSDTEVTCACRKCLLEGCLCTIINNEVPRLDVDVSADTPSSELPLDNSLEANTSTSSDHCDQCSANCFCVLINISDDHNSPTATDDNQGSEIDGDLDVEEIYQVLGRDILKSSLLEDIDLYLECDEDSLYVMPPAPEESETSLAKLLPTVLPPGSQVCLTLGLGDPQSRTAEILKCDMCDYENRNLVLIKNHKATVHDVKDLFSCQDCSYKGKIFRHFQKHMKRQHSKTIRITAKYATSRKKDALGQAKISRMTKSNPTLSIPGLHSLFPMWKNRTSNLSGEIGSCSSPEAKHPDSGQANVDLSPREVQKGDAQFEKTNEKKPGNIRELSENLQKLGDSQTDCCSNEPSITGAFRNISQKCEKESINMQTTAHLKQDYFCDDCTYQGKTQKLLKMHRSAKHAVNRKLYKCNLCDKVFKQKRSQDTHMNSHRGIFDFPCDICDKTFAGKDNLRVHKATHRKHNWLKCCQESCEKSFKTISDLSEHQRTVHGEKTYHCGHDGCSRKFARPKDLDRHQQVHLKTFVCCWKDCDQVFRDNFNREIHYKTHTGEQPYKCEHCSFRCAQKSSLKRHDQRKHKI